MASQTIKVEGLELLRRNLRRVSAEYPKEMKAIHKAISEPVAKAAKGMVARRSGRLSDSIRPSATQKLARVAAGRKGLDKRTGYNYAGVNHYGGYPGSYSGNPFLTDALSSQRNQIVRDYERMTKQFIERVWQDNF